MSQGFLYLRSMCLIYRGQPHTELIWHHNTGIPTKTNSHTQKYHIDFLYAMYQTENENVK